MNKWILIVIVFVIILWLSLYWLNHTHPECYLTEQNIECGYGYYSRNDNSCFTKIKLNQCCRGDDYMLKGVYGDLNCWYIMNGQQLNTS